VFENMGLSASSMDVLYPSGARLKKQDDRDSDPLRGREVRQTVAHGAAI
jgi:hypothetical protein